MWEPFQLSIISWPKVSGELNAEYWQVKSIPKSRQLKSRDLPSLTSNVNVIYPRISNNVIPRN